MITPDAEDLRDVFVTVVREWIATLSRGDFVAAASMIDAANSYGVRWGAPEIEAALREYSGGRQIPRVSDPSELPADERPDFGAFDDGTGFWLDYAVPLDGEWSDLTAQFEFHRRGKSFAVVLHDMHVL